MLPKQLILPALVLCALVAAITVVAQDSVTTKHRRAKTPAAQPSPSPQAQNSSNCDPHAPKAQLEAQQCTLPSPTATQSN